MDIILVYFKAMWSNIVLDRITEGQPNVGFNKKPYSS